MLLNCENFEVETVEPTETLFVGEMSVLYTKQMILELFENVGTVVDVDIIQGAKEPKIFTGYGFVTFETVDEAVKAKRIFQGFNKFGRKLRIGWTGAQQKSRRLQEVKIETAEIFFSFKTAQLKNFVYEQTIHDIVAQFTDCEVIDVTIKQYTINTSTPSVFGSGFLHLPVSVEGVAAAHQLAATLSNVIMQGVCFDFKVAHTLSALVSNRRELMCSSPTAVDSIVTPPMHHRDLEGLANPDLAKQLSFATQSQMKHLIQTVQVAPPVATHKRLASMSPLQLIHPSTIRSPSVSQSLPPPGMMAHLRPPPLMIAAYNSLPHMVPPLAGPAAAATQPYYVDNYPPGPNNIRSSCHGVAVPYGGHHFETYYPGASQHVRYPQAMLPPPMMQQQLPQYGIPVPQPVYGAPQMSAINNVGYSSVPTAYPPQQQQPGFLQQQQQHAYYAAPHPPPQFECHSLPQRAWDGLPYNTHQEQYQHQHQQPQCGEFDRRKSEQRSGDEHSPDYHLYREVEDTPTHQHQELLQQQHQQATQYKQQQQQQTVQHQSNQHQWAHGVHPQPVMTNHSRADIVNRTRPSSQQYQQLPVVPEVYQYSNMRYRQEAVHPPGQTTFDAQLQHQHQQHQQQHQQQPPFRVQQQKQQPSHKFLNRHYNGGQIGDIHHHNTDHNVTTTSARNNNI